MGDRLVGKLRIHLGALTRDAPDDRAQGIGRGKRSAGRQGGERAGHLGTDLDGVPDGGLLPNLPQGRGRTRPAGRALDRDPPVDRALGAAARDA